MVKTTQRADGTLVNQFADLLISDQVRPMSISIPIAALDSVISALQLASEDARRVWHVLDEDDPEA